MSNTPVYDCVMKRRSVRCFEQKGISVEVLKKLVNAGRVAPSAANKQPLEYIIALDSGLREKVFHALKWAAYIAPEGTPKEGERPTAYIIIVVNNKHKIADFARDVGAAAENIILTALEEGIGSCWLRSVDRKKVCDMFQLPEHIEVDSVLALGYPGESPVMVEMNDSIKYWRKDGVHYVPKRRLDDILHINNY
jgi:nitroreductase